MIPSTRNTNALSKQEYMALHDLKNKSPSPPFNKVGLGGIFKVHYIARDFAALKAIWYSFAVEFELVPCLLHIKRATSRSPLQTDSSCAHNMSLH